MRDNGADARPPSAFDVSRAIEAKGFVILEPFLALYADEGRYVATDKGQLAPFLQEVAGDVLMSRNGQIWGLELKVERRFTGNLFLETWSNRNLSNATSHARRGCNPGWMYKTTADVILYYFLDTDDLFVLNTFALKQWAFGSGTDDAGRIWAYPEKSPSVVQLNEARGRCVPVSVLRREMTPPPKHLSVRQLMFGLGDAA